MKVLLLNGSPRGEMCTYTALTEAAGALQACGLSPQLSVAPRSEPSKEFCLCSRSLSFASEN